MAETAAFREGQPFGRRVLFPVGTALGAWILLNVLTSHLFWFGSGSAYRIAATILYPLLGLTIGFSSPVVYSILRMRGASTTERIFWAYTVPVAWVLKEVWRVSAFFSPGEALYYALAPVSLAVLVFQIGYLSLCELLWRWRDRRKGEAVRIWTAGPVAGLVIFAILIYFMAFWGNAGDTRGSHWFYLYMEGYKALFVK